MKSRIGINVLVGVVWLAACAVDPTEMPQPEGLEEVHPVEVNEADETQAAGWSRRRHEGSSDVSRSAVVPELNGLRVKLPGNPAVYLIDQGVRRHIPNPETYERLFRDWAGIQESFQYALIDIGSPLSSETALLRAFGEPAVYLVEPGVKRWITSPAAMDRYYFAWERIIVVPPFLLASLPDGPNLD